MRVGLRSTVTVLLVLSPFPAAATTLAPGDVVVSGSGTAATGLLRVDPVTGAQELIAPGDFGDFSLLGTGTIYALSGDAVVAIDTATGSQQTVSSGGDLVAPTGIAVDAGGRVFVSDHQALGGAGAVFEIDVVTGAQSALMFGSFLQQNYATDRSHTDLEISPGGALILLDPGPAFSDGGDVWSIDVVTGAATSLYTDPLSCCTAGTTGLGVAPNGDIYISNGLALNTYVLRIDAVTGLTTIVGDVRSGGAIVLELLNTDIAIGHLGRGFITDEGRGIFPWDVTPWIDAPGGSFAVGTGHFNEVQIIVPEPASALLCALGVAWMGVRARRASR
jgi:hypothetical protein